MGKTSAFVPIQPQAAAWRGGTSQWHPGMTWWRRASLSGAGTRHGDVQLGMGSQHQPLAAAQHEVSRSCLWNHMPGASSSNQS